jgi:hypothetical protein
MFFNPGGANIIINVKTTLTENMTLKQHLSAQLILIVIEDLTDL